MNPYITGGSWVTPGWNDSPFDEEDEDFEGEHVHEFINRTGYCSY